MSVNWGHAHPAEVPVKSVPSGLPRFWGSLSPLLPHKILAPAEVRPGPSSAGNPRHPITDGLEPLLLATGHDFPRYPPSGHQRPFHLLMPPPGSSPQVSTWPPRPQGTPAPCLPEGPVGRAAPTRAGVLLLGGVGNETPHMGAAFQLPKCTFQPPSFAPSPFPGRSSSSSLHP